MVCYHPISVHYLPPSDSLERGKIFFRDPPPALDCTMINIPCSKCVGCRYSRSQSWAVRCFHESSLYDRNCFVTLTYNNSCLPNPPSLVPRHFQLFMKRLRFRYGSHRIRFFHCGEYGSKYGRPHYHACLFNFDFPDKVFHTSIRSKPYYVSDSLSNLWPYGFSLISDLTFSSAAYVARYIVKKSFSPSKFASFFVKNFTHSSMSFSDLCSFLIRSSLCNYSQLNSFFESHYFKRYFWLSPDTGDYHYLLPEYITMSRRPGIASDWFKTYSSDVFPSDFVVIDGKKYTVPKYYDGLYELTDPDGFSDVKSKRVSLLEKNLDNNTPDRLSVRKEVFLARTSSLKRLLEESI